MQPAAAAHSHADAPHQQVNLVRFGMITFLASEAMLFAGLIGSYIVLWVSQGKAFRPPEAAYWPVLLTGINTVFLVSSSATLHFAENNVVKGKPTAGWLAITVLLGAIFVGVQGYEWTHLKEHENLWFDKAGTYGSCFFTLTGFHGLHVAIGVLMLAITLLMSLMGRFTPHNHAFFECTALYWHFVDIVWIFLFAILYVVPRFLI
jgi:cytochrome c oxidase subunit 3